MKYVQDDVRKEKNMKQKRKYYAGLIGTITMLLMIMAFPVSAKAASYTVLSDGWYMFESAVNANRVLDVHNWEMNNGANLELYQKNCTTNQVFYIQNCGDGWYIIKAIHSGLAIDVAGGSRSSNTNVWTYEPNFTSAQKWRFYSAGNGYYYLYNQLGNYLDDSNASTALANNIIVYSFNGSKAQKWKPISIRCGSTTKYVTAKGALVLRAYASTNASKLVSAPTGASVTEYFSTNGWSYVKYGSRLGYMSSQYLSSRKPQSEDTNGNNSVKISLSVPVFRQYDVNWKNVKIGTKTIGQIGCTTTCLAMKYSYHTGNRTTPDVMKGKLKYSNNDLIWSSVTKLGYSVSGAYNSKLTNNIMSTIYKQLKSGRPVIVGGRTASTSGSQHWVVVTAYKGNSATSFKASDFTIIDPNNSGRTTLQQFMNYKPYVYRLVY